MEVSGAISIIIAVVAIVSLLCTIVGLLAKFSKDWREDLKGLKDNVQNMAIAMAEFKTGYVTRDQCEANRKDGSCMKE